MICFTEQQKQEIERMRIFVIEFKRLLIKCCKVMKNALMRAGKALSQHSKRLTSDLYMIQEKYQNLPPKGKYKAVWQLSKCGFTEKQINLMVGGAYHCRNNC